jgi:3-oxoacyl-[acyl-carrier protein] reductase
VDSSLEGKRALVCGSSQGIGRAAAAALAAAGATVTLLARNRAALEAVRDRLDGSGHVVLVADFDEPEAVRDTVAANLVEHGPWHILVNNAGGPRGGPAHTAGPDTFLAVFRQHLLVNQVLVQTLLPGMCAAGFGRIINVISTSVKEPIPDLGVSNTIRGAVASWAKTLAGELGAHGITVNNVLPGFTRTARLEGLIAAKAERLGKTPAEVEAEARATVPLGRFAEPEEIAAAIAFLASPLAGYINGINLPVDGGRTRSL